MHARLILAAALLLPGLTHAESLHFDAASVKRAADQDIMQARPKRSLGHFRWSTSVLFMVGYAYRTELWRVSHADSAPGVNVIYDVDATTGPDTTEQQTRDMLRALLDERFHIQSHRLTKNAVDGYSLTIAKGGPKLPAAPDNDAYADGYVVATRLNKDFNLVTGSNATSLQIAEGLQRQMGTNVLDQTGLTGRYNFELQVNTGDSPEMFPELLASAVKQIGLKLVRYKGPVEFLVIDRLDKLTEN